MFVPPFILLIAARSTSLSVWQIMLCIGLAALSITLFVLSKTRWGQARPLAKSVWLAVFAHLLLLVYAYGTRLHFFDHVGHGGGDFIVKLNLSNLPETDATLDEAPDQAAEILIPPDVESPTDEPAPNKEVSEAPALTTPPDPSPADNVAAPPLLPMPAPTPTAPLPKNDDTDSIADAASNTVEIAPNVSDIAQSAPSPMPLTSITPPETSPVSPKPVVDTSSTAEVTSTVPLRPADGAAVPQIYRNRAASSRLQIAIQFGGSPDTEAAVDAAHRWLVAHQSPDGRWNAATHGAGKETKVLGQDRGGAGAKADTGVTALALLSLLAGGHTHLDGEHREAVQHGLEFLLRSQRSDGCLAGQAELFASMYCHGMATLALGEALAMTGDQRIRPYLERAVHYTLQSQHPNTGGWRYQPGDPGDMSQFGWQLMALKSAEQAGLPIPEKNRAALRTFLASVASGRHKGLASYRPGDRPSRTMTAEALACRFFLKEKDRHAEDEALDFIMQELPKSSHENVYYWYYATLSLFQTQDVAWQHWNTALQHQLLNHQRSDGDYAGSWDPDRVWGSYGGRVFSTSLSALCLEVYYRYLPLLGAETHEMASQRRNPK